MEKKYIHYKKVEGNFGIEIDKDIAKKYIKLKKEIARLEKELAPIESKLKEDSISVLSKLEEKKFTSNDIDITYIKPYVKNSFDTTRFKSEKPTLYKKYIKETNVRASVKIEVL